MRIIRSAWEEDEESIYSDLSREDLLENDQISAEEEAFMLGWNEAG